MRKRASAAGYARSGQGKIPFPVTNHFENNLEGNVTASKFRIPVLRNMFEFAGIFAWWLVLIWVGTGGIGSWISPTVVVVVTILGCWTKTLLFGMENIRQLFDAAKQNLSHHRFLILMAINMSQMITAFALDFHVLYVLNPSCFAGVAENVSSFEAVFDFFYLSTLNFSFFGYSDILPQTIPAKIVNLTEIVLAFVTVIFILSDFMSLKESIASPKPKL